MNRHRISALLATAALAATMTACASDDGRSVPASKLVSLLRAGSASVTSAHVEIDISAAGQRLTGSGDETLRDNTLTALDMQQSLPGGDEYSIRIVGGKTYAQLPAGVTTTTKPWVLVRSGSTNSTVSKLADTLDQSLSSFQVDNAALYAKVASDVRDRGSATVDGVRTTRYSVRVDVDDLPASFPQRDTLISAGVDSIPLDVYLDARHRPVRVSSSPKVQDTEVEVVVTLSRFNAPVRITAPPATEVDTA